MKEIDLTGKNYYIRGFTSSPLAEGFSDYLANSLYSSQAELENFKQLLNSYSQVSILSDLWIEEEVRGQGIGKKLVLDFIEQASNDGAEVIILLLDTAEAQREGFSLKEFYKSLGFVEFNSLYANWMIRVN